MLDYDPFSDAVFDDPYPVYRQLRDEAPLHYIEEYDCWFLSRFADIWREEQDHASYTIEAGQMPLQLFATGSMSEDGVFEEANFGRALANIDPPAHTELRAAVAPSFKPAAARALEARTRELVRGFVDEFADRGECDVIADLGMRTSVRIACTIIGLPLERAEWFVERVNATFERDETGRGFSATAIPKLLELQSYVAEFIARHRKAPEAAPGIMPTLFRATLGGEPLTDADISSNLFLMLVGGTETLPKAFSAAVHRLAEHPDQRAALVAEPSRIPAAFNEALRYDMPTQMLGRRVARDKEIRGHKLKEGQGVLFMWASANRDEREFPDPDTFDIGRNARRILSFGSGAHSCLGAHIARMEGKVMLEELLARVPEYEIETEKVVRVRSEVFRGFASLPIRF